MFRRSGKEKSTVWLDVCQLRWFAFEQIQSPYLGRWKRISLQFEILSFFCHPPCVYGGTEPAAWLGAAWDDITFVKFDLFVPEIMPTVGTGISTTDFPSALPSPPSMCRNLIIGCRIICKGMDQLPATVRRFFLSFVNYFPKSSISDFLPRTNSQRLKYFF